MVTIVAVLGRKKKVKKRLKRWKEDRMYILIAFIHGKIVGARKAKSEVEKMEGSANAANQKRDN